MSGCNGFVSASTAVWEIHMTSGIICCFHVNFFFYVNIFPLVKGCKIWMHLSYRNKPGRPWVWSSDSSLPVVHPAKLSITRDGSSYVLFSELKIACVFFHFCWKYRVITDWLKPLWTHRDRQGWSYEQCKTKLLRLSSDFFRSCSSPCSARQMGQVTYSDKHFPYGR